MDLELLTSKRSLKFNSIWKKLEQTGFKFYCVSCHKERHLSVPARAGSAQFYIHAAIATAFSMLITWPLFHWKGIVLAIPVLIGFEAVYRLKMRAVLVCPDCNFDPILYLVDRDKAVQQVENLWRKKFEEHGYPYPEKPSRSKPVIMKAGTQTPLPETPPPTQSP